MLKRIMPPTCFLAAMILVFLLRAILPIANVIQMPWRLQGIIPILFGVWLNLAADRAFKQKQTTIKPFQESSSLITDSMYRWSRNPMYLGFVLILAGTAVLLGSISTYLAVMAFVIMMDLVFIRVEERMLEERFHDDWRAYKAEVRRWI